MDVRHLFQLTCRVNKGLGGEFIGIIQSYCLDRIVRRLELSDNKLEGLIPISLCTLQRMESLLLSWNELNGSLTCQ